MFRQWHDPVSRSTSPWQGHVSQFRKSSLPLWKNDYCKPLAFPGISHTSSNAKFTKFPRTASTKSIVNRMMMQVGNLQMWGKFWELVADTGFPVEKPEFKLWNWWSIDTTDELYQERNSSPTACRVYGWPDDLNLCVKGAIWTVDTNMEMKAFHNVRLRIFTNWIKKDGVFQ